jgi:tetratricopeptide (TPR) repeat protein
MLIGRQYSRARDHFLEALSLEQDDRVSRIGLACALDELGLTRAAMEQLHITVERHSDDAPSWFALGFCQEKLGETEDAIVAYEAALDISLQLRNAHERLSAIYLKLDHVGMAIAHYEHLCWCEPGDIAASLTLANLYVRAERYEDAIQRYEFALTIDPDNWETQDDLVSAYVGAGRYDEAVELLRGLIEQRPDNPEIYVQLGDLYSKKGQDSEALEAYSRASTLNPDYLEARIKAGTARLRRGEHVEAAEAFSHALEINDRIVSAYVGMGVAQQAAGKTEDALASFEMAAGIEPNSTLLFSEAARLQLMVSAAEQARRYTCPRSIAAQPEGPPYDDVASMIDTQIGNIRCGLRLHPNHADLHYRLGLLLRHSGDLHGAIEAFQQAISINPNYVKALTKLGLALQEAGQTKAAVGAFQRALAIDPETLDLHYQVGLIFADRGEFALALERFEHAARQAPEKVDYVANLALALQNMGLLDRAAASWQTLCELTRYTREGADLLERVTRKPRASA